ncbi:unnamed protein product [Sphagnum jensenii]|uniref:Uncharacterized protein n=2 Tax=Sphagnum jensenii TaxID=128206 RepID=A0ABP1A1R9_9BRYO
MTTQECRGASYQATEHFAHSMASPAILVHSDSIVHAAEEETRFSGFGDADETDLQMRKATVMMLMNKIHTFITNIMSSAEKAPDGATTACAGRSATASVNDSSQPISWCFLNYVVSRMVE